MEKRDTKKDPRPGDRFLTPRGNIIEVVLIGTENYRPFATLRKFRKNLHRYDEQQKPEKGAPRGHHKVPGVHVWFDDLLPALQRYTTLNADDLM